MIEEFGQLERRFFERMMEFDPIFATEQGLHQFDSKLPSVKRSDILAQIEELKEFLKEFEKFAPSSLSEDRKLDRELAIHILRLMIFHRESLRQWEKSPDVCQILGESLFHLIIRNCPSKEKKLESIAERLKGMPKLIEDFRRNIREPVKLWTEMAIESCEHFPRFLESVLGLTEDKDLLKELKGLINQVNSAIRDYKKWLLSILPNAKDEFAIGEENFEKLIELRELDLTPIQILEMGKKYLKENKKELERISKLIDVNLSMKEIVKKVKSEHPQNFEMVLNSYREAIGKAKAYIAKAGVVTIPSDEAVRVVPTPEFEVHLMPFAGMYPPPRFEKEKLGIFTVSPPANEQMLKEHNYYSILNTTVHEAYPGHHLQLTCATYNPSLIRALTISVTATEFIEGWAHYCEDYMDELGYSNDPKVRLIRTIDMIWRACRVIIDVRLSQGLIKFDEAVDFLVQNTGMEKEGAVKEVRMYTKNPGYFLSYLVGKHMLKEVKERYKEKMGDKYSDRSFHDSLLYSGSLPIKYQKKILLGE
jgi:uncharacterized protein (DUF885 family)